MNSLSIYVYNKIYNNTVIICRLYIYVYIYTHIVTCLSKCLLYIMYTKCTFNNYDYYLHPKHQTMASQTPSRSRCPTATHLLLRLKRKHHGCCKASWSFEYHVFVSINHLFAQYCLNIQLHGYIRWMVYSQETDIDVETSPFMDRSFSHTIFPFIDYRSLFNWL